MEPKKTYFYRGIEIKRVPPDHICYRCCGDRWEFWNEKIGLMYMRPTIEELHLEIDWLADAGLIDCLPKQE